MILKCLKPSVFQMVLHNLSPVDSIYGIDRAELYPEIDKQKN